MNFLELENEIFWRSRQNYYQILESFLNRRIGVNKLEVRRSDMDAADKLKSEEGEIDFEVNP